MLAQEGVGEVVVVDDGSTDGSVGWLEENHPSTVFLPPSPYSLNPSRTYHRAIQEAKGDTIVWSGGEMCAPDPTAARRLVVRCGPDTIALARVYNSTREGPPGEDWTVGRFWPRGLNPKAPTVYSGEERPVPFMFWAAFPRDLWERTGGYDRTLGRGIDGEFASRCMDQGITFQGVGDVVALHLPHPKV